MAPKKTSLVPGRALETMIRVVRGRKVILDRDLASLYQVETKALNQAVQRNNARFPETYMFRLTAEEAAALRSQSVTLEKGRGMHSKYASLAFSEHGVVMLSAVLRSRRAIEMSIQVVNAFVQMRRLIAANTGLTTRVEKLEGAHKRTASVIQLVMADLDRLTGEVEQLTVLPDPPKKRRIGFQIVPAETKKALGR